MSLSCAILIIYELSLTKHHRKFGDQKIANYPNDKIMKDLFLPSADSGFFGALSHWLGMGILFGFFLGWGWLASFCMLFLLPSLFLSIFFDK